MWVRLLIWFALSATLLGVGAWLTATVTQVEGESPFLIMAGRAQRAPGADRSRLQNAQVFGVLLKTSAADAPPAATPPGPMGSVLFGTRNLGDIEGAGSKGAPLLWFFLPAGRPAILLLNNLTTSAQGFHCKTDGPAPLATVRLKQSATIASIARIRDVGEDGSTIYYAFKLADPIDISGLKVSVAEMPASPRPYVVYCHVRPKYTKVTFTRRSEDFIFLTPGASHTIESVMNAGVLRMTSSLFPGFAPPDSLPVTVSIKGTDQITFSGGRQDYALEDPANTRQLRSGGSLTAEWSDVSLEQYRDVMLVVIGTLIAIGVTTLIEGLRPIIDGRLLSSEIDLVRNTIVEQEHEA